MSYNKLLKTIDKVESKPVPGIFDISSIMLPTNEVVKNMLVMEDSLSREDAEILVDGFIEGDDNIDSEDPLDENIRKKSINQKSIENLKNEGDTPFKQKMIDDSVDDSIKLVTDTDTGAPLSSKSPYHRKAKDLIQLIKEKVTQFFRKVKELIREIAAAVVSIVSSIPGAALMVSPFAFNVPGMITMLMQMIGILTMLASKVSDLTSFFKYFKMLPLVLNPSDLNKVSTLINTSYGSVTKAFEPLDKGIESFLKSAKSTIKSKSNSKKLARNVTKRLRKLKYIKWVFTVYIVDKEFKSVHEDDVDEVQDILDNWDVVYLTNRREAVKRKKVKGYDGKEVDIDELVDSLDKIKELTEDIKFNLPDIGEPENFIYDVRFSDGRSLFGITRQEVDGLELIYNVIYSNNVKYSFI